MIISKTEYTFVNMKFMLNKFIFVNGIGLKSGLIYDVIYNNITEIIVNIDDIK